MSASLSQPGHRWLSLPRVQEAAEVVGLLQAVAEVEGHCGLLRDKRPVSSRKLSRLGGGRATILSDC